MGNGEKMNQIKSYQGYVNQDLMDNGKHPSMDNYLKIMHDLFHDGDLNMEQVFMLMGTLTKKALEENAKVLDYLRENDEIENLRTDTVDYGWITKEGELTDHCKSKLREEGFNGYEEE